MSRLPSSRGSSTAAAGGRSSASSPAQRRPGVLVQSPKSDIYVAMLGVALAAMLIATLLMVLILARYEFKTKVSANPVPVSATRLA